MTIILVDHEGTVTPTMPDDRVLVRGYDFGAGDSRVIGDISQAIKVAANRAVRANRIQQVRLSDGPLLGQKSWLIQSTDIPIKGDVRVPLERGQTTLGECRRLVRRSRHLSDSSPVNLEMSEGDDKRVLFDLVAHDVG